MVEYLLSLVHLLRLSNHTLCLVLYYMKSDQADSWKSRPFEKLGRKFPFPGSKYCNERTSMHYVPNITYYYLWFPADLCYEWVRMPQIMDSR